jgi:hypothetical protein
VWPAKAASSSCFRNTVTAVPLSAAPPWVELPEGAARTVLLGCARTLNGTLAAAATFSEGPVTEPAGGLSKEAS